MKFNRVFYLNGFLIVQKDLVIGGNLKHLSKLFHFHEIIPKLHFKLFIVQKRLTSTAFFSSMAFLLVSELVLVAQSCPTLCDPMDCSLPTSSVYGILQARILEWIDIPFSRGSSRPRIELRSPTLQADALPSEPPGKVKIYIFHVYA